MKKKILIIEDDEDIISILKPILELEGFKIICAVDGEDGMKKIEEEKPDLVILDLFIPKINGNELCRRVKNDPNLSKIPIIMLTAKSTTRDELEGIMDGADDYITKPFNPLDLIETIKYLLTESPINIEERKKKRIQRLETRLSFEDE